MKFNEITVYVKNRDGRILLAEKDKLKVLIAYHDDIKSGGHDGFKRTYFKIKQRFFWNKMKNDIAEFVKTCHICQINKFKFLPKFNQMSLPKQSEIAFETVHLDYGEFSKKKEGQSRTWSFLLLIDEATRFTVTKAMTQDGRSLVAFFEKFKFLDKIKKIISDCGKSFLSEIFLKYLSTQRISHQSTAPYHPNANGLAERKIREIKKFVSCYDQLAGNWKQKLEYATNHENRSFSEYLGCTPYFALNKKNPQLNADLIFEVDTKNIVQEERKTFSDVSKYRNAMKRNFDKRHYGKCPDIQKNDFVLVKSGLLSKDISVLGPFKVSMVITINGIIKDVQYINTDGNLKIASISNVLKYHHRSDDQFKVRECKVTMPDQPDIL